jgi:uridine kinase
MEDPMVDVALPWRQQLNAACTTILTGAQTAAGRSALVGVTGIDGSGKGYLCNRLARQLADHGARVALISVDGWLNLPATRFNPANPAEHFYQHSIRFDEMFEQLVLPLRHRRSVRVETDYVEETAGAYRRHLYEFQEIDIILLEGIYLLKRQFQGFYDLSFWIDCSFATALERAIFRGQEGLSPQETIAAYRTIYFPAQEIHFQRDHPRAAADSVIDNG